MKKAIVLTAYNRPDYLAEVLDSWLQARGLYEWDFYISLDDPEDNELKADVLNVIDYFKNQYKAESFGGSFTLVRHSPKLGVLKHPYVIMGTLFQEGYEFVLRAEDDLVVSDGILEYFDWGARTFKDIPDVATIHGFSLADSSDEKLVEPKEAFNSWVFGTWNTQWEFLKANWDIDYSTNDGVSGRRSGFDWNFDLRVYPKHGLRGIYPEVSRVLNIGAYGVHGSPEDLPATPSFRSRNQEIEYFDIQA